MDGSADGYREHARQVAGTVRIFKLGDTNELSQWRIELDEMMDVMLGRTSPPIDVGVGTLMEVAEAFHARLSEMQALIQRGEADGSIVKGSAAYKFRTGELRTVMELMKRSIDMGSRRITAGQMAATMKEWG